MALSVEIGADEVPFIRLGEYSLRLDLEELDDFFLERSRLELRETPEVVEDALARLKSLIQGKQLKKSNFTFSDMNHRYSLLMLLLKICILFFKYND